MVVFSSSATVVSAFIRASVYGCQFSPLHTQLPAINLSSCRKNSTKFTTITPFLLSSSCLISRPQVRMAATEYSTLEVKEEGKEVVEKLQKGIAEFYDESSGIWEEIWGEHMHHGFYEPDSTVSISDHKSAQIRMIEEALRFSSVSKDPTKKPNSIIDVGCGIGGSSRYLARKYGAECKGITLSPVQAQRAQALADAQGLQSKVSFEVADALSQPFPDGQFDLVWSMESGEHMPDKEKFVGELTRVAAPGATIIIVTWCHRDLSPSEQALKPEEQKLLNKICDSFYLPAWCSTSDYVKILESLSLEDIKTADWSEYVAPFWPAVIRSALTWRGFTSLLRSEITVVVHSLESIHCPFLEGPSSTFPVEVVQWKEPLAVDSEKFKCSKSKLEFFLGHVVWKTHSRPSRLYSTITLLIPIFKCKGLRFINLQQTMSIGPCTSTSTTSLDTKKVIQELCNKRPVEWFISSIACFSPEVDGGEDLS